MKLLAAIGAVNVAAWVLLALVVGMLFVRRALRKRARRPAPQVIDLAVARALREIDGRGKR